jgi:hypothetical protein
VVERRESKVSITRSTIKTQKFKKMFWRIETITNSKKRIVFFFFRFWGNSRNLYNWHLFGILEIYIAGSFWNKTNFNFFFPPAMDSLKICTSGTLTKKQFKHLPPVADQINGAFRKRKYLYHKTCITSRRITF